MPSPIGHALAGTAVAWGIDSAARRRALVFTCAFLAAAPDLDLLFPYTHRAATHSLLAVALVAMIAILTIAVTGQVTGSPSLGSPVAWSIVVACTAAYGSHLVLDWLGADDTPPRGLQILWPFSDRWFISDLDLFRGTARREVFSAVSMRTNALAIAQEIAIVGPVALAVWLLRRKAAANKSRTPVRTSDPADRLRPSGGAEDTAGISDRPGRRAARQG